MKNILGRNKSGSDQEKALKQSDVGAWLKALTDAQTNGGGEVWCFWGTTVKGGRSHVVNYTIDEVLEHDNFFEMVQKKKGPGFYRFEIMDNETPAKKLSEHHFTIGDLSKKKKKKDEDEDAKEDRKSKKTVDLILEKLLDVAFNPNNDGVSTKDLLELQMGMQKTAMDMQQKSFEMMSAMMGGGGGDGKFEGFLQGVEFYRGIAPQVEKEEPLTALALGGLNMLSQFVGKGSGSQAQAGQQRVPSLGEAQQLKEYAEKILSGEVQQHPQAPGKSNARPAVVPPQTTGTPGVLPAESAGEPRPGSPTAGQREAAFYVSFVEPFRAACTSEPDALDLAEKLLIMYNYTRQFMSESPHPLMADFLSSASITEFQNAFINFCATIPELRENKPLQAEIANFLAPVIQQMLMEGQEGQENVTEADSTVIRPQGTDVDAEPEHEDSTTSEVIDPEVQHEDVPG